MAFNVQYVYTVIDKYSGPLDRIRKNTDRLNARMKALKAQSDAVRTSLMEVAAIGFLFALPIKSAIKFEAAMADIRKVVDFAEPQGLKKMSNEIREMSKHIPISAIGLAQIVASAGQAGVAERDLTRFAKSAAKMAVAFDVTAQEAGDAMGAFANIFKIPINDIDRVGDAINHLSNNTIAKAKQITRALQNKSAAAGNAMNLEANQTVALASTFVALQIPVDRVGSIMEKMARTFTNTKLVGKKMAREFRTDGKGSLVKYFKELNKLSPDAKMARLTKHFGEYAIRIKQLSNNMPMLERAFEMTSNEMEFLNSMTKEYNSRIATSEAKVIMFKNKLSSLSIALGNGFLPALILVVSILGFFADRIDFFATEFPFLTSIIMTFIGAMITMRFVTLAYNFVLIQSKMALLAMNSVKIVSIAWSKLSTLWLGKEIIMHTGYSFAVKRSAGAQALFNSTLFKGAGMWIAVAAAGLAFGLFLAKIIFKIDSLRESWKGLLNDLKGGGILTKLGQRIAITATSLVNMDKAEEMAASAAAGGSIFGSKDTAANAARKSESKIGVELSGSANIDVTGAGTLTNNTIGLNQGANVAGAF